MSKFFLFLLALLLAAAFAAGGYQWGRQQGRLEVYLQKATAAHTRLPWPEPMDVQAQRAQREFDALAVRMGRFQARMLAVEALGERLVEIVGLDPDEFDFKPLPAQSRGALPNNPVGLQRTVRQYDQRLSGYEIKLGLVDDLLQTHRLLETTRPDGIPVAQGWMSSGYGTRTDPFTRKKTFHRGIDFPGKRGDSILATATGIVTSAGWQSGYGKVLEISHGDGYVSRYAHSSRLLKAVGERVQKGDLVALIGSTGRSTGPHLHFEILREGNTINPRRFIKRPKD